MTKFMPIFGATSGLISVALGGGLASLRSIAERRAEGRALDAAITAEVRALLTTILERGIRWSLVQCLHEIGEQDAAESEDRLYCFPRVLARFDYFAAFNASLPKIGLLPADRAADIMLFYVAAKSSAEMLLAKPGDRLYFVPRGQLTGHLRTEIALLDRAMRLGAHLAGVELDLDGPEHQPFRESADALVLRWISKAHEAPVPREY